MHFFIQYTFIFEYYPINLPSKLIDKNEEYSPQSTEGTG